MRLVLAARLSRLSDGQTGIETQDEDAREWALANGHQIITVAADTKSGTAAMWERPHLRPWVTDPNLMATYDGIVAAKQDRLSRADWSDEARIRLWAEEHGKALFIVDRNLQWPPRNPDDRERWNNGAEQARREWEATSKRYSRMQRALRNQGYLVGRAPYGYRIIGVNCGKPSCECQNDHKTLEPDPITAPIVREMAARYMSGQSSRQIRDWLKAINAPVPLASKQGKGSGWREHQVLRILHNPATIGRIQSGGKTYLRVESLISVEDFNTIQEMAKARRKTPGIILQETALLTGVIKCDRDKPMYRVKTAPRRSAPDGLWYYCNENLCPKGTRLLVPLAEVERIVHDAVMLVADEPHKFITVIPGDTYGEEIKQLKTEQSALDTEDEEQFQQWLALRDEIKRLRGLPRKPPKITTKLDGRTVGEVWDSLDTARKRQWLLSRRPADWLSEETSDRIGARVLVNGPRDPEYGLFPIHIDLGELTEMTESLRTL